MTRRRLPNVLRGWREGYPDECAPNTPVDWLPVRDVTPAEQRRLTLTVWRLEHRVYSRSRWGHESGASNYQGKGV